MGFNQLTPNAYHRFLQG